MNRDHLPLHSDPVVSGDDCVTHTVTDVHEALEIIASRCALARYHPSSPFELLLRDWPLGLRRGPRSDLVRDRVVSAVCGTGTT